MNFSEFFDDPYFCELEFSYRAQQYAHKAGAAATGIFFCRSGLLRISAKPEKTDLTLQFIGPGTAFILPDSFVNGETSQLSVQALKKSEIIILGKERLTEAFGEKPSVLLPLYEDLLAQSCRREILQRMDNSEKRFQKFLISNSSIIADIPDKYLASYLNISDKELSGYRQKYLG